MNVGYTDIVTLDKSLNKTRDKSQKQIFKQNRIEDFTK